MLRQYCFLNASATKISSRHSLRAGSITTQHLMDVTTHKTTNKLITNHHITNKHLMDAATHEHTSQHMWYVTKKNTKKRLNLLFRRTQF